MCVNSGIASTSYTVDGTNSQVSQKGSIRTTSLERRRATGTFVDDPLVAMLDVSAYLSLPFALDVSGDVIRVTSPMSHVRRHPSVAGSFVDCHIAMFSFSRALTIRRVLFI
jgi:hypothetical protein